MHIFSYPYYRKQFNCFILFKIAGKTLSKAFISSSAILVLFFILFFANVAGAQSVTTNSGSGLAATYPSLASAITALNGATITSPVVITLSGNETAPVGGYSITQLNGTATNTITIQGSSSTITAYSPQAAGNRLDAIFKIIGGDYITIQNFTMQENASNTVNTVASNTKTEFGVAIFYNSVTNGAKNNTIQNNIISLSSTYQNAIGIYSTTQHSSSNYSATAAATATSGLNTGLKIYGNTISNVAFGIEYISTPNTASIIDAGVDIGGSSSGTANTITYGINTVADGGWVSFSTMSTGINYRNGTNFNIGYNTITSNSMTIATTGITVSAGTNPTGLSYTNTVNNNTIVITETSTGAVIGVDMGYGIATGTIVANNNTITINQNCTAASSAAITGMKASYTSATKTCNGNIITINQTEATGALSSTTIGIDMSGTGTTLTSQSNTVLINQTISSTTACTTPITGIKATSANTTVNIGGSGLGNAVTIKQAVTGSGVYGLGAITFINADAGHGTLNILYNTVNTTGSSLRTTGTTYGISHNGTITTAVNVSNNIVNIDRSGATATTGDFRGITSGSSTAFTSGNYYVNNNNITLVSITSGTTIGLYNFDGSGAPVKTFNGNNITIAGSGTTIFGMDFDYGTFNVGDLGVGNTISITSSATSPTIYGINTVNIGTDVFRFKYNTINTISATAASTSAPIISAIRVITGTGNIISNNTIYGISTGAGSGNATINGIEITGGTSSSVFKNKIYDLSTSCTGNTTLISDIKISGGVTNNVYNNLIGQTNSFTGVNSPEAIRGINITSTTLSSTNNIYYNTIKINATSTGTNFGTTGIYHTTSATVTTSALDMRNNIIVNTSTATGTGFNIAFRRSSTTLTNFATTSNNNLFYAGTPAAKYLIMYDGTNSYQTVASYKTAVGPTRETASVSENPTFLSTTGSDATFLHIDPSVATQAESGGMVISSYTDDYDGDIRSASTPDIGADEGSFSPADFTPPSITYTTLTNSCIAGDRTITGVSITDGTGVPTTGSLMPRIYYKKNSGSWFSSQGILTSGSATNGLWSFTILAADMGGLTGTDIVSYFVIAEDVAPSGNITSNPATGLSATDVNTITVPPTTPNTYTVIKTLSGTYTVGSGGNYSSLTAAVADYNASCLGGPVVFSLTDASYTGTTETYPITINANSNASSTNTLTIKPASGASPTITSAASSTSVIKLNGASYIIIDGSNNGTITKNLTIINTYTSATATINIDAGANNNNIKNTIIKGTEAATTNGVIKIGSTGNNSFNTIQNNDITAGASAPYIGVYIAGASGSVNSNNLITGNRIFDFSYYGIYTYDYNSSNTYSSNEIYRTTVATTTLYGIYGYGTNNSGEKILANYIHDLNTGSSYAAYGIYFYSNSGTATTVANNIISLAGNAGTIYGIWDNTSTSSALNIYFNTISISGTGTGTNTSACYNRTFNSITNFKNNILVNSRATGTSKHYAVKYSATVLTNLSSDNNDYYNSGGTNNVFGVINTTDYTNLVDFRTASGKDASSVSVDPQFTGFFVPVVSALYGTANNGTGVSTDYNGITRSSTPDIGAIEFSLPACTAPTDLALSVTMSGATLTTINGSFTAAATPQSGYLVVRTSTNVQPSPVDGVSYSVGNNAIGYIEYVGVNPGSWTSTGLTQGTQYFYWVFSYSGALCAGGPAYSTTAAVPNPQPSTLGCPGPGTYTIGATGDYSSITQVVSILSSCGLSGAYIFELKADYSTASETFPITIPAFAGSGSANTVTFRPAAGVTANITGSNATALISFNGASYVYFDGRQGGSGTPKSLTISNTSTSGPAVIFTNDAKYNIVKHSVIKGVNTGTSSGVIVLGTTTGSTGNDNNTIDNCDLTSGTTAAANIIYAAGTATRENDNNTISNNNIFNFGGATACGISISSNNNTFSITGNSFYQTAALTTASTMTGIYIVNTSGGNFTISNNYFGGNASALTGSAITGTWTANTTGLDYRFCGISVSLSSSPVSTISGNKIQNFSIVTGTSFATPPSAFCGINLLNSGGTTVTGNTIGSTSSAGNISVSFSTSSNCTVSGIYYSCNGIASVTNNTVAGISILNPSSGTLIQSLYGIYATSSSTGPITITGNTVGSATAGLSNATGNTYNNTLTIYTAGIFAPGALQNIINNNNVTNIAYTAGGNATTGINQTVGIFHAVPGGGAIAGANNSIQSNNVSNITSNSIFAGTALKASAVGIFFSCSSNGSTVRQNIVHSISNAASTSNAVNAIGFYYGVSASITNIFERNFVHSISLNTTSTTSSVDGIYVLAGNSDIRNNMIRLGFDAAGNPITKGYIINGINEIAGTNNYYFNTVYVGGVNVVSVANTYAFLSAVASGTRNIQNNIFWNARTNTSGSAYNYAIKIGATTGLTCNYNDLYVSSSAQFGAVAAVNHANFTAWKSVTGLDAASVSGDPKLLNTTGDAASVDLHINSLLATPIEGVGLAIGSVTNDYDNDTRAGLTPTDIGADAGDFTPADVTPPNISYTLLTNTSNTNGPTVTATITDASGINIASGTAPRLYFKRSYDANTFNDNTNTTDGWKWVECTSPSGNSYVLNIDYSLIFNSSTRPVQAGDYIQYFVVAQDNSTIPNISLYSGTPAISPLANVADYSNLFALTGTINQYWILPSQGTYTVGSSGPPSSNYTTLTGANGFFAGMNDANTRISGDITLNVIADITEPGTNGLNQWTETPAYNVFTVTIKPDAAVLRTISGTAVTTGAPMININGADRVIIDGNYSGAGQYLLLRNTNSTAGNTGPTIQYINSSVGNTIKNCIIENNGTTATRGTVNISTGTNTNISVSNNKITSSTGGTVGTPAVAVYSATSTNIVSVLNNEIYNWSGNGVLFTSVGDNCNISGNSFYQSATLATAQTAISVSAGNNHTISDNYIGGTAVNSGGSAWTNSGTVTLTAIALTGSTTTASTVQNNTIANFSMTTSSSSATFIGINITGTGVNKYNIGTTAGNIIGSNTINNSISISGPGTFTGIKATGAASSTISISNNTIAGISQTSTNGTNQTIGIYTLTNGIFNINKNTISKITSAAQNTGIGTSSTIIGILATSPSAGQIISGNTIHSLTHTAAATSIGITGVVFSGPTTGTNLIERNNIHSFNSGTTGNSTELTGIYLAGTAICNIENNMIRLGVQSNGDPISASNIIAGINDNSTGVNKIFYNSVYIGGYGTSVSQPAISFAYRRNAGTGADEVKNNVFYNARGATLSTSKHYAISLNVTTAIQINNNDLFVNSSYTNAFAGYAGTTDYSTLAAWIAATGFDANSVSGNPEFINPTGDTSAVDLHIKTDGTPTPVESAATTAVTVTNDIDAIGIRTGYPLTGQVNGGGAAPDLGADEGDFFASDITAPVITYTALANSCNSSTTYNIGSIVITDPSGVNTTAGTKPRLYYKKSTDANDLTAWKYVEANGTASPFDFTIDYSLLNSGSVTAGDIIQYFIVAQDMATVPNIAIKSGTAAFTLAPSSVNLTSAAFPITGTINNFSIVPCAGTITVGTGGNYLNLTGATGFFQAVNATASSGGLTGDISVSIVSDLTEDGTNALNQWLEQGGSGYTITIQPNSATEKLISGSVANGMIRLSGADRVTFNGNYSGSGKYLRFRNTNTSNSVFTFINDASGNTIENAFIEGSNTSTTVGTILFSTATTTGNDNNTISNCEIKEYSTNYPVNAIFAAGTAGKENDGNIIQNCNIYNYYNTSSISTGINISTGNSAWTITGNSFYQTVSRTSAANDHYAVMINNSAGNSFNITNNIIGGSASDGSGTYRLDNGSSTPKIIGIYLQAVGTTSPYTAVTGNTIKNIYLKTNSGGSAGYGIFCGIYLLAGTANISDNTIGAETGNTSIYTYGNSNGATTYGISSASASSNITISNNKIGSFDIVGGTSTTNTGVNFIGIATSSGSTTVTGISNNLIGSLTTPASIQLVSSNVASNPCSFYGIKANTGASYTQYVSGNTIANISNINSSTSGLLYGINVSGGGQFIVNNNIVKVLKCSSPSSATGATASLSGIILNTANNSALSVSGNTVYELTHTGSGSVSGIVFSGGTSTGNTVSKNLVYNLKQNSLGTGDISGIYLAGGVVTASNNIIRLGLDEVGSSVTISSKFNGIVKDNTSVSNIYYNSVYIGGTGVATNTNNTYAFRRVQSGSTDNVKNNVFYNSRSNATTGGKHYSIYLNAKTSINENNNVLFADGTGNVLGYDGTADRTSFALWKSNSGLDNNSISANPQFIDPLAATPDLHISTLVASPVESGATAITGLTDDYDAAGVRTGYPLTGQVNGGGLSPDIGADEGDFMFVDMTPPSFTYTNIPTQALCGSSLTNVNVTINDAQSGISLSSNKPRMYFRRSVGGAPGDTWDASQFVEGSYVSGTTFSSIWNFSVDFSSFGITLVDANAFEYYFVAQDIAPTPNIGYSQSNGSSPVHTPDVATPTVFPAFSFGANGTFNVNGSALSGTINVGTGQTYATLTAIGGLFSAINTNGLSGDLTVLISSNIAGENGTYALNQWAEYCGGGYFVRIQPADASQKTISGTSFMSMIDIKAQRVIFDGRFNGSGRYLKFTNTQTGGSQGNAISFSNASNDTIRYCEIVSSCTANSTADGVLLFSGSQNILIDNNFVYGSPYATNIINAYGNNNQSITISNNEIHDFLYMSGGTTTRSHGIRVQSGNGSNWTITGNSIYNTSINGQNVQTAISFYPGASSTGNVISSNWIGGTSANGGIANTPMTNTYDAYSSTETKHYGIDVIAGTIRIDSNNITNIYINDCDYSGFIGMYIGGSTVANSISYNSFGSGTNGQPDNTKMIKVSGGGCTTYGVPGYIYAVWNQSATASMCTYDHNNFYYLWQSGAGVGGAVQCIVHQTAGPATITNNSINGPQASGQAFNSFGIRVEPTASNSGNIIDHNIIAGPYINTTSALSYGACNFAIRVLVGSNTVSGSISKNVIWDMRNADYGGTGVTEGIYVYSSTGGNGNWNIFNNQITLKNNGSTANCVGLYGIEVDLNSASTTNVQYNTVYIGGSNGGAGLTGADFGSYAYFRFPNSAGNVVGDALTLKNNIFINSRLVSTTAVTGHFAIANYGSANYATNWNVSDNNFLFTNNGSKSYIGLWGTSTKLTLANWKTSSGKDANSYSATVTTGASNFGTGLLNPDVSNYLFNNPLSDLHINITDGQSYKFVEGRGAPISITTDYDGDTRDASAPDIGADEFTSASCTPVAITSNPSAPAAACEGTNSFSFTVAVSGSPNYNYQWQVSPDGTSWTNIANGGVYGTTAVTTGSATASNTLTITNADASYNGKQYRCVVQNCNGTQTATSSAATLTVNAASVGGTATAVASSVCTGNGTTINLTGYTGTIQWQTNASGSWQDISGQTGTSYTTPSLTSTTSYQAVVTNSGCSPAGSTVAQVTVSPISAGGTAGAIPTIICSGGTSTIKLTNYVGTIQWQTDASGTWQDISGANSDVYNTPALNTTTSYQAVVTSGACASALSNTIVITVEASAAQPDPIAGSIFPCYGSSQVYSVTNVSGITYTWTFPADWVQTAGGNTNSVTVTVGQDTNNIQVVPSNSCGTGTPRTLLVKPSYPGIWTGAVSSDWHDPNNWGCNTLPDSTTNIKIPDGSGNLPIINTIGTAFCHDLIVVPNASLILQSAGDLSIYGNLTNYGSITGLGTFVFKGQENAAINGPVSGITLSKMTVSKKPDTSTIINVNIPLTISTATANALTFNSGLLQLNSGGSLSLKSGPTINARAGLNVNGGTLVAGNYSITNKGLFKVTSGVANIGTDPGNSLLSRSGSFTRIYGGQLNIAARLEVTCLSGITNTAYLTVTGGLIKLCTVENTAGNASFDIGDYSNIHISGGTIEFQNASSNAAPIDLFVATGTGTKVFSGGLIQFGNSSTPLNQHFFISNESVPFYNIALVNCSDVTLSSPVSINGSLDLTLGNINTNTPNLFRFNQGASWTSGSDNSFIKGPAEKAGNEAFVFPVGDIQGTNKVFAPMGIDAPSQITDVFRAQYGFVPVFFTNNPDSLLGDLGNTSNVENWDLSREFGTSQVKVSLYWKNNIRSTIGDPNGILVAHWNAALSKWEDMGATYFSDGPTSGHIQAGVASDNFSPFTFGANKNYQSPLPVSLLEFKAECKGALKDISWKTATETNNDYFTIERSFNGVDWQFVSNIDGAGNSNQVLSYNFVDNNDGQTLYYRLRQTDFNGQNELYDPIIVNCNSNNNKDIVVYPNPFESLITLSLENIFEEDLSVNIYDVYGRIVEKAVYHISGDYNNMITLELDQLPAGIYYLEAKAKAFVKSTKIIKN